MRQWRMVSTDRSGAETTYPATLQRRKIDALLLAAGVLTYRNAARVMWLEERCEISDCGKEWDCDE